MVKVIIGVKKAKVLVIATGGTVVSTPHPKGGLAPKKGLLKKKIEELQKNKNNILPEKITVEEWSESLDSSRMEPKHWVKIAKEITDNYKKFDGFVVVHGTDTMAYTASAISFMIENIDKPIVFTGAQIPLDNQFNDAERNIISSLYLAGNANLREVVICFANTITRGNRTTKWDNWSQDVFISPNYPPLGNIGFDIRLCSDKILTPSPTSTKMKVNLNLFTNILVIWLVPGFDDSLLEMILEGKVKRAIVLVCYGTGNAPIENSATKRIFGKIAGRKIPVVVTTQCMKGAINLSIYKAGNELMKFGFISGGDMTIESCVTKMAVLMGQGLQGEKLKIAMERNMAGELSTQSMPEGFVNSKFDDLAPIKKK